MPFDLLALAIMHKNLPSSPLAPIVPRIMLAPMEGVVDYQMRRLLTGLPGMIGQGGFDRCVTEFVRVTDVQLPDRVFYRYCPELQQGCQTEFGVPVYVQLLGSDLAAMASNALRAVQLGAPGIDINFGCPAKTVNRSNGGSILLREPARVAQIVQSVCDAVAGAVPVTAKIRLGFESRDKVQEIAGGICAAGATEVCVHARSKSDGYKPPAYWSLVKAVTDTVNIPVIINGEIWSVADAVRARELSGCQDIMLGRGALSCPDLAAQIRASDSNTQIVVRAWESVVHDLARQFERSDRSIPRYVGNRTKQWLAYLRREYSGAQQLFNSIKPLHDASEIQQAIDKHIAKLNCYTQDMNQDMNQNKTCEQDPFAAQLVVARVCTEQPVSSEN